MRVSRLLLTVFMLALSVSAAFAQAIGGSKVSNLPFASTPLDGSELFYIIQQGNPRKTTLNSIFALPQTMPVGNITGITGALGNFQQCINANGQYGANGTAGDGARIQTALNAAQSAAGHCVYFPSLGKPYIIDVGVTIEYGIAVYGDGGTMFDGLTATIAQWTQASTWFECTDPTNPCVSIPSHGTTFDGINLIWNQTVPPTSGTYTPTAFPDGIYVQGTFFQIRHSLMVGGTRCLNINYATGSGGGTYSRLEDLKLGCLSTGIKETNINDNVYVSDVDVRPLWYATYASLTTYVEANLNGLDINYWDNPVIKAYQCFECRAAFKFTNSTSLGNTHALYNGQLVGIQCNLDRICMDDSSGATVSFSASNVLGQQDTGNSLSDTYFQFPSNLVDVTINDLTLTTVGGSVLTLGNGSDGKFRIGTLALGSTEAGFTVNGYSTVATGQTAFAVAAGSQLTIGRKTVIRATNAGAFIAGAGADNVDMPTFCWTPFGSFTAITYSGTGSAQALTTDNYERSNHYGTFQQVRLISQPDVTTAVAGSLVESMQNFATDMYGAAISLTFSTASTGYQTLQDTNWREVNDAGQAVGRGLFTAPAGSAFQHGNLTFCGR